MGELMNWKRGRRGRRGGRGLLRNAAIAAAVTAGGGVAMASPASAGPFEDTRTMAKSPIAGIHDRMDEMWVATGRTAGLDGVAAGVAQVAEILEPIKSLVPPSVSGDVSPATSDAFAGIRNALGSRFRSDSP